MREGKTLGIIPARYGSSRFPGKPLARLHGKTLIRRVYERAALADSLDALVVATDDPRIAEEVRSFGGQVGMTSERHPSGTDRCAELAARYPEFDRVINIQGDEPFLVAGQLEQLASLLRAGAPIATLAHPLAAETRWRSPHVVKVVRDRSGKALYFSRSAIPFLRNPDFAEASQQKQLLQHVGLYGFQSPVLQELARLEPTVLEKTESLEQLRWLEWGYAIQVGLTDHVSIGIDTPEDLARAERAWSPERDV